MNLFSQPESRRCMVTAVHTRSSKNDVCSAIQQSVCNVVSVSSGHGDRATASAVGRPTLLVAVRDSSHAFLLSHFHCNCVCSLTVFCN